MKKIILLFLTLPGAIMVYIAFLENSLFSLIPGVALMVSSALIATSGKESEVGSCMLIFLLLAVLFFCYWVAAKHHNFAATESISFFMTGWLTVIFGLAPIVLMRYWQKNVHPHIEY